MKSDVGTENDKMNNENEQPTDNNSSSLCSGKKKWILIGSIAGGVVLIVAIVLIVVFVTKDDDSSSSSSSSSAGSNGISWEKAYELANKAMENLDNEEKFNLLFGIDNLVSMREGVCVGMIEPNDKIENFRGLCLQDGPAGVRISANTTSWQAQINTASTFNRTLWTEYGKAYGNEFKAKGINVALGPAMNILRTPVAGRIWESYSEDPYLSGEAATYIIKAIQSTGVIACAKHYVGNDQETNRKKSSSNIPEQALWEIYIEPFYRSVKDADVGSVMSSYNDVNGTLLAKNKRLLQDILKDKIGFKGFVMSDWWAIKDNEVINFNSGEDMNMPGGAYEGGDSQGRDKSFWSDYHTRVGSEITQDRLDDAVRRVLSTMYRFNQLDSKYPDINLDNPTITDATKKINREAAGQSNVLLKNENGVLPISKDKYSKIAIIGNDAFQSDCNKINDCSCKQGDNQIFKGHLGLGYGSGTTDFQYIVAPYDAIKARADNLGISIVKAGENLEQVTESTAPVDLTVSNPSDFYFIGNSILSGWSSGDVVIDLTSDLSGSVSSLKIYVFGVLNGTPDLQVKLEDTGVGIKNQESDQYPINFWSGKTDNIIEIELNSTSIGLINATTSKKIRLYGNGVTLRAITNNKALLEAEPFKSLSNSISFTVGKENITEAEALADANSDIKLFIVFIMADSGEEYISLEKSVGDRYDMDAWHNGNELVNAIVAKKQSGQKILVVINAPGPINVPWKDSVDAIIFSGMGGAESGNGLADVLFGDLNPSGHLPYVWGTIDQYPASIDLFGNPSQYDYNEGLFVGQRWFDLKGYAPIWPFGFGLSYTSFSFSDLSVSINDDGLTATFNVKNTGNYDGDVVPMLFLKFPDSVKSYPSKVFKGFDKQFIKKGETKSITIFVDDHGLSYYNVDKAEFERPTRDYVVYIGTDARNILLTTETSEWNEAIEKANKAMENLDNEEKFNLLFGVDNLVNMWNSTKKVCVGMIEPNSKIENFRGMCLQDGPAGVRTSASTTSWQAQINTASTFNKTLWTEYGKAYGNEFRAKGINVALGPAMNILRSPIAGRIWESYSEDPFLSGEAATYIIKAIQSTGVIACAKHYIGNDQETNRKNSSSNIPEQALWEIYLEPFYRSVKDADVGSIMSSYNDVNGTLLAKNKRLLQDILKDTIGFKGFVMSDWWAIKDNEVINFNSGEDMNMPGGIDEGSDYFGRDKSHWTDYHTRVGTEISQDRLDDAVRRVLSTMYRFNQLDSNYPDINLDKDTITDATKKLNREAAGQSNVLLKNENDVLPLSKTKYSKIAIIGNDAFPTTCNSIGDCSCKDNTNKIFHGHLGLGYGSGTTTFKYLVDPLSAITARATSEEIEIVSAGSDLDQAEVTETFETKSKTFTVGNEKITDIGTFASEESIDLFIVFLMADSGEQYIELEESVGDRYSMDAWHNGNELVDTIVAKKTAGTKTRKIIVVINAPGPINVPWKNNVDGIIFSGMGGSESGNGLADVLFGDLNPSGHLPYVWGTKEQYPAVFNILGNYTNYDYDEGVFIGQRWFDKQGTTPIWPFGYGLSYTTFVFSGLTATYDSTNKQLVATFSVENTGSIKGDAVPMLFLHFPDTIKSDCDGGDYPNKLFKGFEKVSVEGGQKKSVSITVDEHALSYYSVSVKGFVKPSGTFKVYIGKDASDSGLSVDVSVS